MTPHAGLTNSTQPTPPRPRHARRGGFTLVELIVASTIIVLILGAASLILTQVVRAHGRIEQRLDLQQQARLAIGAIDHAMRNVHRPPPGSDEMAQAQAQSEGGGGRGGGGGFGGFAGGGSGEASAASPGNAANNRPPRLLGEPNTSDGLPTDRIEFFTIDEAPVRRGYPESDLRRVEFFIDTPRDDGVPWLVRRLDPTRNPEPDEGGVVEPIAEGVVALEFRYLREGTWLEEWVGMDQQWPSAIRVSLMVVDPEDPTRRREVQSLYHLPYAGDSAGAINATNATGATSIGGAP